MLEEPQPFGPNHPAPIIPCAVPTKPDETEPDPEPNDDLPVKQSVSAVY